VNVDALLVASFAADSGRARFVLDLGAGVGGVMLSLHHFGVVVRGACLEKDRALVSLCADNLRENRVAAEAREVDLTKGLPADLERSAELVVANPPFFEPGERRPAERGREPARAGSIIPFLDAATRAVEGKRGRAVFVYPAREIVRLLTKAEERGLVAKRIRLVHPKQDAPARIALVELKLAKPGGLVLEPPLYEWSAVGRRSSQLSRIISGRAGDRK
jgi:tRNA1(Val) A37 N6-methylase TrmN6